MALLGTDYQSAYMSDEHLHMTQSDNQPHIIQQQQQQQQQQPTTEDKHVNESQKNEIYEQTNFFNGLNNDNTIDQISYLKNELQKQKQIQMKLNYENESIIDRFLSKKKDVIKLINLALTILLGVSIHYVVVDYIKDYLKNNDLSDNKEFFIKIAYPITVCFIIWTSKVFNK